MEWLTLFTEGDGFRVSLIPNSSKEVKNTFSLIPVDRNRKRLVRANAAGFRGADVTQQKLPGVFWASGINLRAKPHLSQNGRNSRLTLPLCSGYPAAHGTHC